MLKREKNKDQIQPQDDEREVQVQPTDYERLYEQLHFLTVGAKAFSDTIPFGVSIDEKAVIKGEIEKSRQLLVELNPQAQEETEDVEDLD